MILLASVEHRRNKGELALLWSHKPSWEKWLYMQLVIIDLMCTFLVLELGSNPKWNLTEFEFWPC